MDNHEIDRAWQDAESQAAGQLFGGDLSIDHDTLTARIFVRSIVALQNGLTQQTKPPGPPVSTPTHADDVCKSCAQIRTHYQQAWSRGHSIGMESNEREINKVTRALEIERQAHVQTKTALTKALIETEMKLEMVLQAAARVTKQNKKEKGDF